MDFCTDLSPVVLMDDPDKIRRRIIKTLTALEDACEQAVDAQLPDLPNQTRLRHLQTLGTLIAKAKSHCDKAEADMLIYIRLQSK